MLAAETTGCRTEIAACRWTDGLLCGTVTGAKVFLDVVTPRTLLDDAAKTAVLQTTAAMDRCRE